MEMSLLPKMTEFESVSFSLQSVRRDRTWNHYFKDLKTKVIGKDKFSFSPRMENEALCMWTIFLNICDKKSLINKGDEIDPT